MSDEQDDQPELTRAIELLRSHIDITSEARALLDTVIAYLREQPDFDAQRFYELYLRETHAPPPDATQPLEEQLRRRLLYDVLADHKGKPQ